MTFRIVAAIATLAGTLLVQSLCGCQAIVQLDESQCSQDAECVALLGRDWTCSDQGVCLGPEQKEPEGLPDQWKCLEEDIREVLPEPTEKVQVSFISVDYESLLVPEGISARACNLTDADCNEPLTDDIAPALDGYMTFEVTKGFTGFFEITGPDILPTLFYSNKGYGEPEQTFPGPVLVDADTVVELSARGDIAADLSQGLVIFVFWDCNGAPAPGVSLLRKGGDSGEVFYFDGALPDRDLTSSRVSRALASNGQRIAAAGITNIKPGFVNFDVMHEALGLSLGSFTAEVRAGHMTTVYMYAGYSEN